MYWSPYDTERLRWFARILEDESSAQRWCVFDNTASGAALGNALAFVELLKASYSAIKARSPRRSAM